jgi:hypothetical protein
LILLAKNEGSFMSLLVNADGRPKTYVVVDNRARTVVAAFNWVGEADRGLKELRKDGADDLTLHNSPIRSARIGCKKSSGLTGPIAARGPKISTRDLLRSVGRRQTSLLRLKG